MQNQRKLQLQIEEQGKCLRMMFEQHTKMENKFKASPSTSNDPYSPLSNIANHSAENNKPETFERDHPRTGTSPSNTDRSLKENSEDVSGKRKEQETKSDALDSRNVESAVSPTKHARSG